LSAKISSVSIYQIISPIWTLWLYHLQICQPTLVV
jgi:hypothetical protein